MSIAQDKKAQQLHITAFLLSSLSRPHKRTSTDAQTGTGGLEGAGEQEYARIKDLQLCLALIEEGDSALTVEGDIFSSARVEIPCMQSSGHPPTPQLGEVE